MEFLLKWMWYYDRQFLSKWRQLLIELNQYRTKGKVE